MAALTHDQSDGWLVMIGVVVADSRWSCNDGGESHGRLNVDGDGLFEEEDYDLKDWVQDGSTGSQKNNGGGVLSEGRQGGGIGLVGLFYVSSKGRRLKSGTPRFEHGRLQGGVHIRQGGVC